ncbi:MAG: aminopeptidase P family protein [FCB group bacterium]|nr:aminopeptidase P family protein [FCB group bacterium]
MNNIQNRLEKIRNRFTEYGIEGFYVTNLTNVRYLSGYTGSAGQLLILPDGVHFFTDGRYIEQSRAQVKNAEIHIIDNSGYTKYIRKLNILPKDIRLGFESDHMSVTQYQALQTEWHSINFVRTQNMVEVIAAVKDPSEIEALKTAIEITDKTFSDILPELKAGAVERHIAAKMSYLFQLNGAEGDSFDTIVASGKFSALPHATPSGKAFEVGDFVVLDFGALYDGYHADMTRTVVIGKASSQHREIYDLVLKANLAGIAAARAGMTGAELDKVCRDIIRDQGYGKEFSHSTGHGIGLEVHTYPRISEVNTKQLLENYVVTIEPGIYIGGFGGVRIEDDCWIHADSCTALNASTKEMLVLD